jgi:hypothetical protein
MGEEILWCFGLGLTSVVVVLVYMVWEISLYKNNYLIIRPSEDIFITIVRPDGSRTNSSP